YTFQKMGRYDIELTIDGGTIAKKSIVAFRQINFKGSSKIGEPNDTYNVDAFKKLASMTVYLNYNTSTNGELNDLDLYIYSDVQLKNTTNEPMDTGITQQEIARLTNVKQDIYQLVVEYKAGNRTVAYEVVIRQFA
ncbi:MAG: hypothetical protein KAS32_17390, partial [Candidatus Peribacteraceae bacterium]|nr:hypothetical protein [Candidatus Peribacteraceae bacterium]